MAKDPAFLMYPGDWNLGTMHMNILEKGCYMELLMLQFARGKFTLAHAKHVLSGSFDIAWATVSQKFSTDGNFYWNDRLSLEVNKRKKYSESRRDNALMKKNIKKEGEHMNKHMDKHMLLHMEDENINKDIKNKIEGVGERKGFDTMPKYEQFNGLPEIKIGAAIQLLKITKQYDVTELQISGMWEIFKVQNLTGTKYYQNIDEIYSHFINWIKTQNFNYGTDKKSIASRSARQQVGADQLLESIQFDITDRRKKNN